MLADGNISTSDLQFFTVTDDPEHARAIIKDHYDRVIVGNMCFNPDGSGKYVD